MRARTASPNTTFSHAFGIVRHPADRWFDPKLHTDTDLFVDPFLMFDTTAEPWRRVHGRLIDFFNEALGQVAEANGNHTSVAWRRASAMFSFPEPPHFCLGYGEKTIFGAGSSSRLGQAMLTRAEKAVRAGIRRIDDFGELMIFGEHFGADRISDMTCNIVMDLFVDHTAAVAQRHGLPVQAFMLPHVGYDFDLLRWRKKKVELPVNPCWTPSVPVMLVPEIFLAELPKMDDSAFWDWVYKDENEQLRNDLGILISENLDREAIIARAKRSIKLTRKYGIKYAAKYRRDPPEPYDLTIDPSFKLKEFEGAQTFADIAEVAVPADDTGFCDFVAELVGGFKWFVEERGGRANFWAGDRPYTESQAQSLFQASVLQLCRLADIDVSPETNAGRGSVDFKFSAGWKQRAVVELKFAKSKSFWDNLERQTPTYMKAEDIACGTIVVIQHDDEHCTGEFMSRATSVVQEVASNSDISYDIVFIDVQPKPSASKLKR